MKILIACEESQAVCKAFRAKGHEAYSCDIQPCSGGHPEWHIQEDVLKHLNDGWDMMIAFPPCTYLTNSGIGYFNLSLYGHHAEKRMMDRLEAAMFFMNLYTAPISKICIENPTGFINHWLPPSQVIHPYFFGDNHVKKTCLWLKELPKLYHTPMPTLFDSQTHTDKPAPLSIQIRKPSLHYRGGEIKKRYFVDVSGKMSGKQRSKTFPGIAQAMADQWG